MGGRNASPTCMDPILDRYLFDTNILIDYWRKSRPAAIVWVERLLDDDISAGISMITEMEMWAGIRNLKEERDHKIFLAKFRRYKFNVTVARRTGSLIRQLELRKDQKFRIPDLIIAATAEYYRAGLVTTNPKDFNALPLEIQVIDCI
jgi:predicted nucleic acid-binding protein